MSGKVVIQDGMLCITERVEFLVGDTFKVTQIAFHQSRMDAERQSQGVGNCLGRVMGTRQRATVDPVVASFPAQQHFRCALSLFYAVFV